MKKISMMVVAAMALTFAACGNSEKPATDQNQTEETTTAPAEAAVAAEGDILKKYEAFVEQALPLLAKVKTGDAAAIQEYSKIAQDLAQFMQDNQDAFSKLSADDAAKFAELNQKLANAAQ